MAWLLSLQLAWSLLHPDRAALAQHGQAPLMDGHAYWAAWSQGLYSVPPGTLGAYLYSPAFAQLLWPLTLLPFGAFAVVWWGAIVSAFWWLLAPLPWGWRGPALVLTGFELEVGNINAFLGLVLVLGLRRPGAWCLVLLTKITPGVGLLWFVVRREWRHLALALGATAVVIALSAALDPAAWSNYLTFLLHQGSHQHDGGLLNAASLPLRLPLAAALVLWGARTSRPWTLAVTVGLANPDLGFATLTLMAAVPRLVVQGRRP